MEIGGSGRGECPRLIGLAGADDGAEGVGETGAAGGVEAVGERDGADLDEVVAFAGADLGGASGHSDDEHAMGVARVASKPKEIFEGLHLRRRPRDRWHLRPSLPKSPP